MAKYVCEIDQKQELIEQARNHFYNQEDFYETISASKACINEHLDDEENEKGLSINIASNLVGIVNDTEPIYDLEDALENPHVKKKTWAGEERVELDPSYREFVFKGYTLDELEEITGENRDSLINYRSRDGSIPKDVYLDVFEDLQSRFSEDIDIKGDLCVLGGEKEDSILMSDVDAAEIREINGRLEKLRNLKAKNPHMFGYLSNNFEKLKSGLKEKLDRGVRTYKADGNGTGQAAAALDKAGYLGGQWAKAHRIFCDPEELDMIEKELPSEAPNKEYSDEKLVELLENNFEDRNNKLQKRIRDDPDLPSPQTYRNHFGDLTNAVWRSEIDKEDSDAVDRDIIIDQLLEKTSQKEIVPNSETFHEMEDTVSNQTVRNHFEEGGFDELVREAGLHIKRKLQNSVDKGDKFYTDIG